ncbi:MAG: DNA alkylation repair protein, partial [Muribaculaceae bacterium]|nr:DNA alkylation repair protein [Muribaculaceae bacterium]
MPMFSAEDIVATLLLEEDAAQRQHLMRFFKTGKGDYGEGDEFIGLTAPQTRLVVKEAKGLVSLPE